MDIWDSMDWEKIVQLNRAVLGVCVCLHLVDLRSKECA